MVFIIAVFLDICKSGGAQVQIPNYRNIRYNSEKCLAIDSELCYNKIIYYEVILSIENPCGRFEFLSIFHRLRNHSEREEVFRLDGEEIVRTYSDMVYRIALRYVRNPDDAEDVYSETFLTYFKKERSFESEEHRKAWLIRVTINCAKDLLGSTRYTEEINEELLGAAEERPTEEILSLREAIEKLPQQQKEVITLFYLQDLTVRQIAEILDKSEGSVKVALHRARENLRGLLEE